jgi:DNA-binding response OmpR family regulator
MTAHPALKIAADPRTQTKQRTVGVLNPPVTGLSGHHILIVEDEMLIALCLRDIVAALGCTSIMASRVARSVALAKTEQFDAAILDLNLAGEVAYPVADVLSRRGIPYIIATGYGVESIDADYRDRPRLPKPYPSDLVVAALRKVLDVSRLASCASKSVSR